MRGAKEWAKDDDPALTIPLLIRRVRDQHRDAVSDELPLPESTVHRLLARRGLTRKSKEVPASKDHRRFEHDAAGELWMSDVMYGPKLREPGGLRQTGRGARGLAQRGASSV